jgi:hypothetical protein
MFDARYSGFAEDGTTEEYDGDLNNLVKNGRYATNSINQGNMPPSGAGYNVIEVLTHYSSTIRATQLSYTASGADTNLSSWIRRTKDGGSTWGPWQSANNTARVIELGHQVKILEHKVLSLEEKTIDLESRLSALESA